MWGWFRENTQLEDSREGSEKAVLIDEGLKVLLLDYLMGGKRKARRGGRGRVTSEHRIAGIVCA